MSILFRWSAAAALLSACGEPVRFPGHELLEQSQQHALVVVEQEGDSSGLLYRFSRGATGWAPAGAPVPVSVGAGGVGKTREGDRRAPTGAYRLSSVFGYGATPPAGTRLPYLALRPETECVDDAASPHYNRIVNPSELPGGKTWTSSEMMRRDLHHGDNLYQLGVVVDYNAGGGRDSVSGAGAGSCIFLHIWRGPGRPTVGCTAFPESDLRQLVEWLDPAAVPLLVQGTREELNALVAAGRLPYALPPRVVSG
jgi:D-alanyl-D-alanine dipeptidase